MVKSKIVVLAISLVFAQITLGQVKNVQGTVTDGKELLANVNVNIKDTDIGVKTDSQGKYQIEVQEGETLTFSFMGKKY